MEVEYIANGNFYRVDTSIPVKGIAFEFPAVVDTGASNTTMSLGMLIKKKPSEDLIKKLEERTQELGIVPRGLHGATVRKGQEEAYTYAACFKNVMVGGHVMEKFYVNIMVHGADDIFVIGNDFLNACNYRHRAGEKQLIVENPNAQKYYEGFGHGSALDDEQLNMLLFHSESKEEVAVSEEETE